MKAEEVIEEEVGNLPTLYSVDLLNMDTCRNELLLEDIKEYYAKNLFFLRSKSVQGYGVHREYGNMLELAPAGFDVHERMVANLQYRIKEYGACKLFSDWLAYESELCNRYIDINTFYQPPLKKGGKS